MAQKSHDLTRREIEILLAVDQLGPEACGLEIKRKLWETAERKISYGVLYTVLQRMQDRSLVDVNDVEHEEDINDPTPAKKIGRPTTRYFKLSLMGEIELSKALDSLDNLRPLGSRWAPSLAFAAFRRWVRPLISSALGKSV